jgi:hypothetical protein
VKKVQGGECCLNTLFWIWTSVRDEKTGAWQVNARVRSFGIASISVFTRIKLGDHSLKLVRVMANRMYLRCGNCWRAEVSGRMRTAFSLPVMLTISSSRRRTLTLRSSAHIQFRIPCTD